MPELIEPDIRVAKSFRTAMADFRAEGRGGPDDDSALARDLRDFGPTWHTDDGFEAFVTDLRSRGDESIPHPDGWTWTTSFWWVEGARERSGRRDELVATEHRARNERGAQGDGGAREEAVSRFLGSIRVRHREIPAVLDEAGLIGYDIAPAARRQGHGTAMLRATLPFVRTLGFDRALITCDPDNVGSRRVMENNGGVFEGERNGKLRFWVPVPRG